jgi:hypothetical protein
MGALYLAYDDSTLYLALDASVEAANAVVIYIDTDFVPGTGVRDMNGLTDNSGSIDNAISSKINVSAATFGAEFAAASKGMAGVTAPNLVDGAGLRALSPADNFPWLAATVAASASNGVVEVALDWQQLLGGTIPDGGRRMAVFARVLNENGQYLANQTLPLDNPAAPEQVGAVFAFDVR